MNETRPVTFLIFGATGDLATTRVFPALDELYESKALPENAKVIGLSRKKWTDKEFQSYLKDNGDHRYDKRFLANVSFSMLDIEKNEGFDSLAGKIEGEAFVYLALAPKHHEKVIAEIRDRGILRRGSGFLLIEKPFGTDEKSARTLTRLATSFLEESQIKRIDHYLGKSSLSALMDLHERSPELATLLHRTNVSSIRFRLFEEKGIGQRGTSYDGVGAFRDVGQNHMLEMLAILAVEIPPNVYDSGMTVPWQLLRANVLAMLAPPAATCELSRRGQYEGYRRERGVSPDSTTETAFEVSTTLYGGKLARIPITFEAGKKMCVTEASIRVLFKDVPGAGLPRSISISIQPDPKIVIEHADGAKLVKKAKERSSSYAAVLKAALDGSSREFVGAEEIQALWRFSDRIVACWGKVPLEIYSKDKPFLVQ